MSDESSVYPSPPENLVAPKLRHIAAWLGPGVIIASVTIGSGELVLASRAGAAFGYSMLWCFLYAGFFKAIQVYTAARHITLTGEHPLVGWRRPWFFPVIPLFIALPAVALMPVAFSAIPEILGAFIDRLAGVTFAESGVGPWESHEFRINCWTTLVMLLCLTLALVSSYDLLERASAVVLGIIVLCVAAAVIVVGPDLPALLYGLFVPSVDAFPSWISIDPQYAEDFRNPWLEVSLYLGAVGGGAYDYIGYIGMIREKRWGRAGQEIATREELAAAVDASNPNAQETIKFARQWCRAPLLDTSMSFFFVILVTLLFAILGCLILNPEQAAPASKQLLEHQEQFLVTLHPELKWLYRGGVFLAFIGTLYGAYEVYQYTFSESVHAIIPATKTPTCTRWLRRGTMAWCFFGGMIMIWLPVAMAGSVVERMTFGSIVSGAAACGIWCFAMLWLDHVRLPKPLRMSPLLKTLTMISGAVMLGLGVQSTIAFFSAPAGH